MEEIIHAFGIDGRLIVIQIVNFAILAGALWYFLYTPVLTLLKQREEKIKKGIEDAEEAERLLAQSEKTKSELLTEARKNAEHIVNQAQIHADVKASEIIDVAEAHAAHMIDSAEKHVDELRKQALKASEADIARAAILAAEKVMNEKMNV